MRNALALAVIAFVAAAPADASRRPCRDAAGKIVPCPKPSPTPTHRCKDAQGRFVACDHGAAHK